MDKKGQLFGFEALLMNFYFWVVVALMVLYFWLRHLGISNDTIVLIIIGAIIGFTINLFIDNTFFGIFAIALFFSSYKVLTEIIDKLPYNENVLIIVMSMLIGSVISRFSQRFLGVGS